MAGKGKEWVNIYKKIQDSWLWQEKPFDRAHAWIDLLLSANQQDKKVILGNEFLQVERGSFVTSELKLMGKWGWSKSKIRSFLKLLEDDNMIIKKSDKKKTTITIVNYGSCQDLKTTKEPQKEANHNDNNKYMYDSNEYKLALYLFNFIKRNNEKAKEPNLQTWAKQFDYILRIDKRDVEEVKQVVKFCQTDSFWFKNILSPDKLRKQYDRLLMQMKEPKEYKNNYSKKESTFNSFKQRDYDFDDLKKKLINNQDEEEILKEADCNKCILYRNSKCFLGKSLYRNMCSSFKVKG